MNIKCLAAIVVVSIAIIGCETQTNSRKNYSSLTDSLQQAIITKMKAYNIKGASIALIDDTTVVWQQGFGYTDSTQTKQVDANTLFSVQSVSKTLTATAFMMEMEKKTIDLDDKLKKYLPEFSVNSRFGPDEVDKITFRQLLSHRAGFGQEAPKGNNFSPASCNFEDHIKSISNSWLKLPVGKFYTYSNPGIDLVGYVLAKNAGKPFEKYMKDQLLDPLGMKSSTFDQSEAYKFGNNARGFIGDGQLKIRRVGMLAAGGLYSSAADLSRFVIFHLNGCSIGKDRLITERLQREMYSVQYKEGRQQAGYALGIRNRPFHGGKLIHHRGGGYGNSTIVGWIPEYKIGIVILTNDGFGSPFINEILEQSMSSLIRIKTGALPKHQEIKLTDKPVQTLPAGYLKKLNGTYKSSRSLLELIEDNGTLYINGAERIPLTAHSPTEFTSPKGELFSFHFADKMKVDYILNLNDANADMYQYNDSPNEPAGPAKSTWNKYLGVYAGANNDAPVSTIITLKNGYLYTSPEGDFYFTQGTAKMTEFRPGLFFSSDGESMEFVGDSLFIGGRPFVRK